MAGRNEHSDDRWIEYLVSRSRSWGGRPRRNILTKPAPGISVKEVAKVKAMCRDLLKTLKDGVGLAQEGPGQR